VLRGKTAQRLFVARPRASSASRKTRSGQGADLRASRGLTQLTGTLCHGTAPHWAREPQVRHQDQNMMQNPHHGSRSDVQPQTKTAESSGAAKMLESNVTRKTPSGTVARRPVFRVALIPLTPTMTLGIAQRLGCVPRAPTEEEQRLPGYQSGAQ